MTPASRRRRLATAAAAPLLLLTAAACGETAPAAPPWHLLAVKLPRSIAAFAVQPEPASASSLDRAGGPNSLIDGAIAFSLRQQNELYGVLEIAEFKPAAHVTDEGFQRDVAGQMGQRVPRAVHLLNRTVYEGAAANNQSIYTWFNGNRMAVLLIHDIRNPDVLLRALLLQVI